MWLFRTIGVFCSLLCFCVLPAQTIQWPPIPPMRQLYHEQILLEMEKIHSLLNTGNAVVQTKKEVQPNQSGSLQTSKQIELIRYKIETGYGLTDNLKYGWLRGLKDLLEGYRLLLKANKMQPTEFSIVLTTFEAAMEDTWKNKSYAVFFDALSVEAGKLFLQNTAFAENPGKSEAGDIVLLKEVTLFPHKTLSLLSKRPQCRFTDSLLVVSAFRDQELMYTYASVPDALGKRIHQNSHPLVKLIAYLTKLPTGRMIFPFLDEIYHGRLTIDSIAPFTHQDTTGTYFSMLVATRQAYVKRLHQGDTAMAMDALYKKIQQKAVEDYLNEINGLHEISQPAIRFRKINRLSAAELYYVAVAGSEEMYTSSFVMGIYPRMFRMWKDKKADSLLENVQYDQYRTFLRLCAAYNTLDDFLGRMDSAAARKLVLDFADHLEQTRQLNDAVDVATTYSSIYNQRIKDWILQKVAERATELSRKNEKKGAVLYTILLKIFNSMDTLQHPGLLKELGIQPVDRLPVSVLKDSAGRIIIQQFFYGDKGGVDIYKTFLKKFSNPNWKIIKKPFWTEVSATRGIPVIIYSNLPLDEVRDLDEHAQDSLIGYLQNKGLEPVVSIHRGHSYSLPSTIEKLPFSSQLVLVGSCGGYQRLHNVLESCPNAAIISSKQVGTGQINQLLIDIICEQMRLGKDIYWPALWKQVAGRFTGKSLETFRDYVPPYQNLGALFIQAYRHAIDE